VAAAQLPDGFEEILGSPGRVELAEVRKLERARLPLSPRRAADVVADRDPGDLARACDFPEDAEVRGIVARESAASRQQRERLEAQPNGRPASEPEVPERRHERDATQADESRKLVGGLMDRVGEQHVQHVDVLPADDAVGASQRCTPAGKRPVVDDPMHGDATDGLLGRLRLMTRGQHVNRTPGLRERISEARDEVRPPVSLRRERAEAHSHAQSGLRCHSVVTFVCTRRMVLENATRVRSHP